MNAAGAVEAVVVARDAFARALPHARPRLIRLARARGVARDDAEDAVQETFLIAWRSLGRLRAPERVDAWLDGICAHVSQHHVRSQRVRARRLAPAPPPRPDAATPDALAAYDPPDPEPLDLTAELHRQDLELLLDRALGELAPGARTLVELCYLASVPQREVAERMGLTLGALELRLHRTRRALRRVLSAPLRADALALGLALEGEPGGEPGEVEGWRETREWCNFCGRQRLRGVFEPMADGRVNMRLRCPDCSRHFGGDIYNTGGMTPLGGTHTFRPALKRLIAFLKRHYAQDYSAALRRGWQECPSCGRPVPIRLAPPDQTFNAFPYQWRLVFDCSTCGHIISPAAFATYWGGQQASAVALQFIEAHPRWILEPDVLSSFEGSPALRFRLSDVASRARLTIFSDAATLRPLALAQA